MIKFTIIHVTDSHIRGTNPKGRIDDFPAAIKTKFREIFELAACQPGVTANQVIIVHSGDLFDMPDISDSVAGEFAELLLSSPCPIYVVPGEHDEFNHSLETIYRTKLGLMDRVRVLHKLGRNPIIFNAPGGISSPFRVQLTGQGRHPYIDDPTQKDYMAPELESPNKNAWIVHAVHGALTPEPFFGTHTLISNCETNAHVVLTGHLHSGYGIIAKEWTRNTVYKDAGKWASIKFGSGHTLFSNPGSLARIDATPEDMLRPVQVTVLEFTETTVTATLVPLKCAAPGSEVLSREHIVKQTEREENMKKFLSLLQQEGELRFMSIQEIIKNIAERKKLPKHIIDDVMRRIASAREKLGREAG